MTDVYEALINAVIYTAYSDLVEILAITAVRPLTYKESWTYGCDDPEELEDWIREMLPEYREGVDPEAVIQQAHREAEALRLSGYKKLSQMRGGEEDEDFG